MSNVHRNLRASALSLRPTNSLWVVFKALILPVSLVAATVVAASAFAAVITGMSFLQKADYTAKSIEETRMHKRAASTLLKGVGKMTYEEATQFCARRQKILPIPKSKREEDKLISRINSLNDASECDVFYLGFKHVKKDRYKSLDGKTSWPSLDVSLNASQPSLDRICLQFKFDPLRTIGKFPCKDVTSSCFIVYYLKDVDCWKSLNDCTKVGTTSADTDIITAFRTIKYYNEDVIGIMVIDDDDYPQTLFDVHLNYTSCIALAVKHDFKYSAPNGIRMSYKSDRFAAYDAEADCIGVTPGKNSILPTIPCDTLACVVCS